MDMDNGCAGQAQKEPAIGAILGSLRRNGVDFEQGIDALERIVDRVHGRLKPGDGSIGVDEPNKPADLSLIGSCQAIIDANERRAKRLHSLVSALGEIV